METIEKQNINALQTFAHFAHGVFTFSFVFPFFPFVDLYLVTVQLRDGSVFMHQRV